LAIGGGGGGGGGGAGFAPAGSGAGTGKAGMAGAGGLTEARFKIPCGLRLSVRTSAAGVVGVSSLAGSSRDATWSSLHLIVRRRPVADGELAGADSTAPAAARSRTASAAVESVRRGVSSSAP
jgi:hypothetical protein